MMDNEILMQYEVNRETNMEGGHQYRVLVTVTKKPRRHLIKIYFKNPVTIPTSFLGLITNLFFSDTEAEELIHEGSYGSLIDVDETITRLIIDWEITFFQKQKAESHLGYLNIDYHEEIKKRRARFQPDQEEKEEETYQSYNGYPITDYRTESTYIRDERTGQEYIIPHQSDRTGYNQNSLLNLKQYQHLKK